MQYISRLHANIFSFKPSLLKVEVGMSYVHSCIIE